MSLLAIDKLEVVYHHAVTAVQGIEAAQDLSCIAAADGTFAMPDPRCNGRVECDQPPWTTVLSAERTYHREPVVVVVAPRRALAGTVVRDDGAPVEGARVALALPPDLRSRFDVSLQHSAAREVAATTDALGANTDWVVTFPTASYA